MNRLKVVLATGDEVLEPIIRAMPEVQMVANLYVPQDVQQFFAQATAEVIILTDYFDPELALVKELRLQEENLHILFINTRGELEGEATNKTLVAMGVYSILPATFTKEELESAILEPKQWHALLRDTVSELASETSYQFAPAEPKVVCEVQTEIRLWRQKSVCVWSPKGGTGKSFITANLGLLFAQAGLKVALFDGDFVAQSLAAYFDLGGSLHKGLIYSLKAQDRADLLGRLSYHLRHKQLAILTASDYCRPEAYVSIDGPVLEQVFTWLRQDFDIVIYDCGNSLEHTSTFTSLKQADLVLLVCDDEYSSVLALRRHLQLLERLGFQIDKLKLVLNKVKPESKLKQRIVEEMLGIEVVSSIDFDGRIANCTFEGKHLVELEDEWADGVKLGLYELGSYLCPKISKPHKSRSTLSKLLGLGG